MNKTTKPSQKMIAAARRELKRRAARQALANFVLYTTPGYQMGWVHQEICDELDRFLADVVAKKSPRLIICMPPRSGKSQLVSRSFPAYAFGRYPDMQIIASSYSSDLAQRFSRDVQRVIDDEVYREVFPATTLAGKGSKTASPITYMRTADLFEIVGRKGAYRACGVGGGITGMGAECLTKDAFVLTLDGYTSITKISVGSPVITYNERTGFLEVGYVEAIQVKYALHSIVKIRSNGGRSLSVTANHPVYSNGMYVEADFLTAGSVLLCPVWEGICPAGIRVEEVDSEVQKKSLLLSGMRSKMGAFTQRRNALLQNLRKACREATDILQRLSRSSEKVEAGNRTSADRENLSLMRKAVCGGASWARRVCRFLLEVLQGCGSIAQNDGREQRSVQEWGGQEKIRRRESTSDVSRTKGSPEAGQPDVRSVRIDAESASASCGSRCDEQFDAKHGCSLRELPSGSASARGSKDVQLDHVAEVERIPLNGERVEVYDIQVSGNHNFFANGILVHNCLIIDDPLKDRRDANSETIRNALWDWYTSTAYTRLSPGGGVIVMNTRWHMDDLVGRLVEHEKEGSGDSWRVINYPAIAEHDEKHRKAGEALHPERYPLETLLQIKKTVGSRDWASLYQQHPVPDGGGLFKSDWIQHWEPSMIPDRFDQMVCSWDMTFKGTDRSDYVVGQVWGRKGGSYFLLDQMRGQWDFVKTTEMFQALANKWPDAVRKLVEDKANGSAVISMLKKHVTGIIPVTPKESKESRAYAVSTLWEAKNVYLPPKAQAPWVAEDFIPELLGFPATAHDDQVDSMTMALTDLLKSTRPKVHVSNLAYLRMR